MPKAILIRTNGKVENLEVKNLEGLQSAVDGFIELLPIDHSKHDLTVYCNEEGRVNELPINMTACLWLIRNNMYPALECPVHGDVIVLGKCDDEGNDTDVPEGLQVQSYWVEPKFEISFGDEAIKEMVE